MKKIKLFNIILCELLFGIILITSIFKIVVCANEQQEEKLELVEYPIIYEEEIDVVDNNEFNQIEAAKQEMQLKMDELKYIEDKEGWFISYKSIVDKYAEIVDPPKTIYDFYTEEEIYLLQRVVETECYGGDFESKVNVACVVLNRINSGKFGNSAKEVITAPNQFAYWRKNISEDTKLAVEYSFEIEDTTNGCIAFHSNEKRDKFNGWNYMFTDEIGHHFFK